MADSENKEPEPEPEPPELPVSELEKRTMGELNVEQRYELADKFRGDGKLLFAARCYAASVKKWQDTLTFVDHCITEKSGVQPDEARSNRLRVLLHSNIAAAHLKQGGEVAYRAALAACNKALHIDASEAKAIFRKGVACSRLGKLDAARECFCRLSTGADVGDKGGAGDGAIDRGLQRELLLLSKRERAHRQQQRKRYLNVLATAPRECGDDGLDSAVPGACAAAELPFTGEKARGAGLRVLVHSFVILVWAAVVWAPALAVAAAETDGWRGASLLPSHLNLELSPPVQGAAALCETKACSVLRSLESCAHQSALGAGSLLTVLYTAASFSLMLYLHVSALVAACAVVMAVLRTATRRARKHDMSPTLVPRYVEALWTTSEVAWVVLACSLLLKAWHTDAARPLTAEQLCTSSSGYPSGHAAISTALLVADLSRLITRQLNTAQLYQQTFLLCALVPVAPSRLVLRYHSWQQVRDGVLLGTVAGLAFRRVPVLHHAATLSVGRRLRHRVVTLLACHVLIACFSKPLWLLAIPDALATAAVLGSRCWTSAVWSGSGGPKKID